MCAFDFVFFCKQRTAYEMRISDWSSDVCSSDLFGRAFPMMMTAAGTVPPARCLVMGAGVAGLQAIATARRLGAIVSATDVRPAEIGREACRARVRQYW